MINTIRALHHRDAGAHAAKPAGAIEPPRPLDDAFEGAPPESRLRSRSVLVPLHGRRAVHSPAVEMARLIAGALGAPLHGLFIGPEPIDASEVPAHVGLSTEELHGMVLDVATSGDAQRALLEAIESRSFGFVVIASELEEVLDERLGVSELAACALRTEVSGVVVMYAKGREVPRLQRILLPLDGIPSTAAAITPAGELARRLNAELDIVLVGCAVPRRPPAANEPPPGSAQACLEHGAMMPPRYVDQPQHEWTAFTHEFVDRFVNAIGHVPPDVSTRFFLGAGEPAAEILRLAGELNSDLVVLVWHGQLEEDHGVVFCNVLRHAPCPVLVLRR